MVISVNFTFSNKGIYFRRRLAMNLEYLTICCTVIQNCKGIKGTVDVFLC